MDGVLKQMTPTDPKLIDSFHSAQLRFVADAAGVPGGRPSHVKAGADTLRCGLDSPRSSKDIVLTLALAPFTVTLRPLVVARLGDRESDVNPVRHDREDTQMFKKLLGRAREAVRPTAEQSRLSGKSRRASDREIVKKLSAGSIRLSRGEYSTVEDLDRQRLNSLEDA